MQSFTYVLTDPVGIHARPAGVLVKEAKKYAPAKITVTKDAKSADATRLMALMSLGCKGGDTITITIEGGDEAAACEAMKAFFAEKL